MFLFWLIDKVTHLFVPIDFSNGMKARPDLSSNSLPKGAEVIGRCKTDRGRTTIYPDPKLRSKPIGGKHD